MIPKIKIDQNTFSLSSGSGSIVLNKNSYYHLLFGQLPKEYFQSKIKNKYLTNVLKNIFDTFFLYGTIYGSTDDYIGYKLTENLKPALLDKDKLSYINNNFKEDLNEQNISTYKKIIIQMNLF